MPKLEFSNSAIGDAETFRERVDVQTMPNGTTWSGAEIGVRPGSEREAEVLQLKDRIAELERENAELRART